MTLYLYPPSTLVQRPLTKQFLQAQVKPSAAVRAALTAQVQQVVWWHKLSPDTLRLAGAAEVPEIQVFKLLLKRSWLDDAVLNALDQAIPFPLLFELHWEGSVQMRAAYKLPGAEDRWQVASDYYATAWYEGEHVARVPLPVAVDLLGLYAQLLRGILPVPARAGESLSAHVHRLQQIGQGEREIERLTARLHKEKQFNRKVEINRQLRQARQALAALSLS